MYRYPLDSYLSHRVTSDIITKQRVIPLRISIRWNKSVRADVQSAREEGRLRLLGFQKSGSLRLKWALRSRSKLERPWPLDRQGTAGPVSQR